MAGRRNNGLDALNRRLARIPEAVREAAEPALVKNAEKLAATMRSLAPVDEGDLKDSIAVTGPGQTTPPYSQPGGSMTVPAGTAVVTVGGDDVRYPHLVEYGAAHADAQPFFWPSVRLEGPKIKRSLKRVMGKAVRESSANG